MSGKSPTSVDRHVGQRIVTRRQAIGQSQHALAEAIGVSFQQVQKYEGGDNRVSASKLYEVAKAQGVPVAFYFDGLDAPPTIEPSPEATAALAWLASPDAFALARVVTRLRPEFRRAVHTVAVALASNT